MSRGRALLLLLLGSAGCLAQSNLAPVETGLEDLALDEVQPALVLPGTRIDLVGRGFADASVGRPFLRLDGRFTDEAGGERAVGLALAAIYEDETHLRAAVDDTLLEAFGAPRGRFAGRARVIYESPIDRGLHPSNEVEVAWQVRDTLLPVLAGVDGAARYLNEPIPVELEGLLLGGDEGVTEAEVEACLLPEGTSGDCATVGRPIRATVPLLPAAPWRRDAGLLALPPAVTGLHPGRLEGVLKLVNRPARAAATPSARQPFALSLQRARVRGVSPQAVSLGQYVEVDGGGFIGAAADEVTLLHLEGTFTADLPGAAAARVDLKLVPRYQAWNRVRYVLDESDALGQLVDLRRVTGRFSGRLTPIARKGTDEARGDSASVSLAIAPVKQVVYVRFQPSFGDSLRRYGLAALEPLVRQRIFTVAARDYAGLNVEFRDAPPLDFALYAQVDVAGPDPNGLGLLGYDNTAGKDVGNRRLHDRIGGVNATTQADGFPGYGGIFAEQFLGFSLHPPPEVAPLPEQAPLFDAIFDGLRPESGTPARAGEAARVAALEDGAGCPAAPGDRAGALACAALVLGNLLGTTLTHEVAHSLGLADPTGETFHNPGDRPDRLMDAGDARPFAERAELGAGPGRFCVEDYAYLRSILAAPAPAPAPPLERPRCD